ncbi:MAG: pentapeptide repeat-containing protein, partial [Pseudomonadota bacterium]
MSDTDPDIARINALTSNARSTWFALLTVLVFVGITLMGVEHIDFYGVDRSTQLPLLNIGVPTFLFFYAAPVLVAVLYGYFHLILIRLWDALSVAPKSFKGRRLGDAVNPWLVTDAALHLRARTRKDGCTTPRTLDRAGMWLNVGLAWIFGLFVLGAIWWTSMPARDGWMTGIAALALAIASIVSLGSYRMMRIRMADMMDPEPPRPLRAPGVQVLLVLALPLLAAITWFRTEGHIAYLTPPGDAYGPLLVEANSNPPLQSRIPILAPVSMPNLALVEKPAGWLPYQNARNEALAQWCSRPGVDCDNLEEAEDPPGFAADWSVRRSAALTEQKKPRWHSGRKPNWRYANLSGAYLSGADLAGAQME